MIHSHRMIIEDLEINYQRTMAKKARANLFDEVKSAAAYWRLLKKTSKTTKVNRQAHQLKKDDGTLTTDDTEKATMLNDYFCTVAEKLIGHYTLIALTMRICRL